MSGAPSVLQVVVLKGGAPTATEVFAPGTYWVGSAPQADLRLEGPGIEPLHAALYFQNGRVVVKPEGQAQLRVNGQPCGTRELKPSDELAIGALSLKTRVLAGGAVRPAAVPDEVAALLEPAAAPEPSATPTRPATPRATALGRSGVAPARKLEPESDPFAPSAGGASSGQRGPPHLRAVTPLPEDVLKEGMRQVEVARRHLASVPRAPKGKEARGRPRLFLELHWGGVRQHARSFLPPKKGAPLFGAHDERAKESFPLWGFPLEGAAAVELARAESGGFRVFAPPQSHAFRAGSAATVQPADGRTGVLLAVGEAAVFARGPMALVAYVQPAQRQPFANPLAGLPWLVLALLCLFGGGLGYFALTVDYTAPTAPTTPVNVPSAAVRLIKPEPKKKEAAKQKLAALKEKARESSSASRTRRAAKKPEGGGSAALKALSKLTAGPSTLAVMGKAGGKSKGPALKLSGLIGNQPQAVAGLGALGIGTGGGTRGSELLRGKGGAGIGALGARGIGRGAVGGTVSRASGRSFSASGGSIDRDAVAKAVNSHLSEVQACYERALLKDSGLAGKVVLEWTISTAGRVTSARTKSSTLRNAAVESCILRSLKQWRFPAARGGQVIVSYPFMFNSVGY